MGKIFKAHQIQIDTQKPVFIAHNQKIVVPEPEMDPAEDAFAEEAFKALSPEHLAGSGEKIVTRKGAEKKNEEEPPDELEEGERTIEKPTPILSLAARKARHAAVLETLKIKELEMEALEEELRNWENELQEKERAQAAKEAEFNQTLIKRRQEVEAEAAMTLKMAKESAASITESARTEAETIKKAARIEVDSVRDKAYKEGYAEGEARGLAAGEEQGTHEAMLDWQNLMKESEMLINELQTSRMGILKSSEEEMLKIVFAFARSILKVEPLAQPEVVLKNIDQALNRVSEVDKVVMRINMRDKSMCQAHKDQFLGRLASVSELRIVEDPTLAPGGIKIETGVGTIDATIESQARELEKALLEKFRKTNPNI